MAAAEEKRVVAGRKRRSSCRVQSTVTVCTVFRSGQVCSTSRGKCGVSLRRLARDRSLRRASARATRSPVLAHTPPIRCEWTVPIANLVSMLRGGRTHQMTQSGAVEYHGSSAPQLEWSLATLCLSATVVDSDLAQRVLALLALASSVWRWPPR